ncbi:hypothetical protein NDU88_003435 [Pleurodeles waltl]|uniref:Uncharacterized protein n=1 Tax=Pleurodeles waltl TaxID=8319 RepID=A0AAV7MR60_PLEWA|nr:hypothetical protein NDU88_003435 [Pleurodeles waltl]
MATGFLTHTNPPVVHLEIIYDSWQPMVMVSVAGWRTSRLHPVPIPDRNGAPEGSQRLNLLKPGIQMCGFPVTYLSEDVDRSERRRAKTLEPGTRISGFPRV